MPQMPAPLFRDRRDAGRRLAAAFERFRRERPGVVVPHAGHLFEEPGALERVTELAADWFATAA